MGRVSIRSLRDLLDRRQRRWSSGAVYGAYRDPAAIETFADALYSTSVTPPVE